MKDMRLAGAEVIVSDFFRFSSADVNPPVTLAKIDQLQLDFGTGLHLSGGYIILWRNAHGRAVVIITGTPEDVFSDHSGALIHLSLSTQ